MRIFPAQEHRPRALSSDPGRVHNLDVAEILTWAIKIWTQEKNRNAQEDRDALQEGDVMPDHDGDNYGMEDDYDGEF